MAIELQYLVNDEDTKKKILTAVESAARLLDQADDLRAAVSYDAKALKDEIDIDTKDFNELVKFYRKENLADTLERLSAMDVLLSTEGNGSKEE